MMFEQVCCVLFAIFLTANGEIEFSEINTVQKINISIFYESLCPDSVKFITETFYPVYGYMRPYVNVRLIPFGKSEVKSETEYHCQHGPRECLRNILQACVLSGVPEQDDQLRFVDCAMKSPALVDYEQCASYVGINWNSVQKCASGPLGYQLILAAQAETRTKTDGPSFVPSIVYNDVFSKSDTRDSLTNPLQVLCRKLTVKASFCGNNQDIMYLPAV